MQIRFNKILLLIGFFVAALLINHTAQSSVLITETSRKIDDFSIQYLYDKENFHTINSITEATFTDEISNQFSLGYKSGAAWFKIVIHNQSPNQRFILQFTEAFWTTLDLYEFNNGKWYIYKNGLHVPLNERAIQNAVPSFPLMIDSQNSATYYVRGSTVSSHIGEFSLYTYEEFYRPARTTTSDFFNIYSGILFFTMLLTGLLYFVMHERLYLYYSAYVFTYIVWVSVQTGSYLYLGIPGWSNALHAIGALFMTFMVLFSRELLEIKSRAPLIEKIFNFSAITMLLSCIGISLNIQELNLFFNIFASLFYALLLTTATYAWRSHYFSGAGYYLIALIIYMPSMALMTFTYNGFIENMDYSRYAFTLGSFIEILIFSFILAKRFIEIKDQKCQMHKELLHEKDSHNQHLEQVVNERTSELNKSNEQLIQQAAELEETKQRLMIETSTDPLSGLTNRRYFLDRSRKLFNQATESKTPLSLLMLDIDRFKGINDTFGHDIGDKAIVATANIFKSHKNENDIISRYGGEEFVILTPGLALESALELAENIRADIENSPICHVDGKKIFLTLSIGVTQLDAHHDHLLDSMLQRADKALYMAKDKGRNSVVSLQK